jgi:hypothetical protein
MVERGDLIGAFVLTFGGIGLSMLGYYVDQSILVYAGIIVVMLGSAFTAVRPWPRERRIEQRHLETMHDLGMVEDDDFTCRRTCNFVTWHGYFDGKAYDCYLQCMGGSPAVRPRLDVLAARTAGRRISTFLQHRRGH